MYIWFFLCVLCMSIALFLHYKSVEHVKLKKKYGKERGVKIGKIYGTISGTMEFIFLIGLWISPQPRFTIPIFSNVSILIGNFSTPILHLTISLSMIILGAWIAIRGVKATRLEVAETHCAPEKLETTGVYSIVRHPQFFDLDFSSCWNVYFTLCLVFPAFYPNFNSANLSNLEEGRTGVNERVWKRV